VNAKTRLARRGANRPFLRRGAPSANDTVTYELKSVDEN
jgi:hypothetical protein